MNPSFPMGALRSHHSRSGAAAWEAAGECRRAGTSPSWALHKCCPRYPQLARRRQERRGQPRASAGNRFSLGLPLPADLGSGGFCIIAARVDDARRESMAPAHLARLRGSPALFPSLQPPLGCLSLLNPQSSVVPCPARQSDPVTFLLLLCFTLQTSSWPSVALQQQQEVV